MHRILAWSALFLAVVAAARADIEFVGVLSLSQFTRFALGDTAAGTTTWVVRGETFAGYKVGDYDAKADTLVLTRDGTELRLRLKDAKVKPGRLELTGEIVFGANQKADVERVSLVYDQENVFPLHDGLTYRITPTRNDDGSINYAIVAERTETADSGTKTTRKLSAPRVTAWAGQRFSVRFAEDLGFTFTPR